jgi:hypothetical protein
LLGSNSSGIITINYYLIKIYNMNPKLTAKDFFLHIATTILLFAGTIALLNILFEVINVAFPQVTQNEYYNPSRSISFPVATLIVVFPLFLFLANLIQKSFVIDPSKKEFAIRKWLIYITLFVAGVVLSGDLITLIYFFLDGQELTTGFLLKILSVLVVIGLIFCYFIDDLKNKLTKSRRNIWRIVAIVLVIGTIVLGFSVLGSPQSQRQYRYDEQKVNDLQNIQWQIINYWQQKGSLPNSLTDLEDPISGYTTPIDSQTNESYVYKKNSSLSFDLCADFNKISQGNSQNFPRVEYIVPIGKPGDNWQHEAGNVCFERSIDPELYPVRESK